MKARTQAGNQIHAVVDTAPDQLRRHFVRPADGQIVAEAALFRRRHGPTTPLEAARLTLRTLARRWEYLNDELTEIDGNSTSSPPHRADAASDQRCRRPSRHCLVGRRRRQPRPPAFIGVVRRSVRRVTDGRVVGASATPSAQPLRRPPRQLGPPRRHYLPPPMAQAGLG